MIPFCPPPPRDQNRQVMETKRKHLNVRHSRRKICNFSAVKVAPLPVQKKRHKKEANAPKYSTTSQFCFACARSSILYRQEVPPSPSKKSNTYKRRKVAPKDSSNHTTKKRVLPHPQKKTLTKEKTTHKNAHNLQTITRI